MLGLGWAWGKEIVRFVGDNADTLKKRGAADVATGFWLTGIEDIEFMDMANTGPLEHQMRFHDYPTGGNTFARGCVVPHRDQIPRLDEAEEAARLKNTPEYHFVGGPSIVVHRMRPKIWDEEYAWGVCQLHCPVAPGLGA